MFLVWLAALFGHPSESAYPAAMPTTIIVSGRDIEDNYRKERYRRIDDAIDDLDKSGEEFVQAERERLVEQEKALAKLDEVINKIKS